MQESSTNQLLAALERDLRRWKILVGAMGIFVAALAGIEIVSLVSLEQSRKSMVSGAAADRITARQFVVVDERNEPLALLGALRIGSEVWPMLLIGKGLNDLPPPKAHAVEKDYERFSREFDSAAGVSLTTDSIDMHGGQKGGSLSIHATKNEAEFELHGNNNESFITAKAGGWSPGKASEADLTVNSGNFWAVLNATAPKQSTGVSGTSSLRLYKLVSEPKNLLTPGEVDIETDSDGTTSLEMYGEKIGGKTGYQRTDRAAIEAKPDTTVSLNLFDQEGKLRAVLGSTQLEVTRTGAEETTAPSSLTLFDKQGKVIGHVP